MLVWTGLWAVGWPRDRKINTKVLKNKSVLAVSLFTGNHDKEQWQSPIFLFLSIHIILLCSIYSWYLDISNSRYSDESWMILAFLSENKVLSVTLSRPHHFRTPKSYSTFIRHISQCPWLNTQSILALRINVAQNSLVVNCTTIFPCFGFQSLSNVSWILILSVYVIFRSNCAGTEASEIFI